MFHEMTSSGLPAPGYGVNVFMLNVTIRNDERNNIGNKSTDESGKENEVNDERNSGNDKIIDERNNKVIGENSKVNGEVIHGLLFLVFSHMWDMGVYTHWATSIGCLAV